MWPFNRTLEVKIEAVLVQQIRRGDTLIVGLPAYWSLNEIEKFQRAVESFPQLEGMRMVCIPAHGRIQVLRAGEPHVPQPEPMS